MTWIVKEGCYGCGRCTFCKGIEMEGRNAKIVDQSAECLNEVAEMCPAEVVQET